MVFKDGKWYVQYCGEVCEVYGRDAEGKFIYLLGLDTGLTSMLRYEFFEKQFLQNA